MSDDTAREIAVSPERENITEAAARRLDETDTFAQERMPCLRDAHDEAEIKALRNRLNRARGQLDAVIRAIDNNHNCMEIVLQLSAVSKALDKANATAILLGLEYCIAHDDERSRSCRAKLEKLLVSAG